MSSLYQKRGIWYLKWSVNGRARTISLRTRNESLAQTKQKIHDADLEKRRLGLLPPEEDEITLGERVKRRLRHAQMHCAPATVKRYHEHASHLVDYFGVDGHITADGLEKYKEHRIQSPGWKGRAHPRRKTLNHEIQFARSLYIDQETGANPLRKVKYLPEIDSIPGTYLEKEDAPKLLAQLDPETRVHVLSYLLLGFRLRELWRVEWGDVDFRRGLIRTENVKTRRLAKEAHERFRWHPIPDQLLPILRERKDKKLPRPWPEMPYTSIKHRFESAAKRAGLAIRRIHDLRHSFASYIAEDVGTSDAKLAELLGHKDVKTTRRYRHFKAERLRRLVKDLEIPVDSE